MLTEIEVGTLVETPSDGIGEVVTSIDGLISVRLQGGDVLDIDIAVTDSSIEVVSPDGLKALTYRSPDEVRRLAVDAPLRLVALTLSDSRLAVNVSELKTRLEPLLTGISWRTWWSRVRPELVDSELFIQLSGGFRFRGEPPASGIRWLSLSDMGAKPSQSRTREEINEYANNIEVGDLQLVEVEAPVRQRVVTRLLSQGRVGWIASQSSESLVSLSDRSWKQILRDEDYETTVTGLFNAVEEVLEKSERGGDFRRLATRSVGLISATLSDLSENLVLQTETFIDCILYESVVFAFELSETRNDERSSQARKIMSGFINEVICNEPDWIDAVTYYICQDTGRYSSWRTVFDEITDGLPPDQYGKLLWIVLRSKPFLPDEFLRSALPPERTNARRVISNLALALRQEGTSNLALGANRVAEVLLESSDRTSLPRDQISEVLALALIIDSENADRYADSFAQNLQRAVSRDVGSVDDGTATNGIIDVVRMAIKRLRSADENRARRELRAHDNKVAELERAKTESSDECARKVRELESALSRAESLIKSNLSQFANQRSRDRFNAQRILLEDVASQWQELSFLAVGDSDSSKRSNILASRLMGILSNSNVKQVAQTGDRVRFELSAHTLVPGAARASGDMTVMAPGLHWIGPDGQSVLLVKTLVQPSDM